MARNRKPTAIRTRRVYEAPSADDGVRVLVDRMWPRGVSKDDAKLDAWMKDLAPSSSLRKWFGHDPDKWHEFGKRYREELKKKPDSIKDLCDLAAGNSLTLVYAARDERHNNAVALKRYLDSDRCPLPTLESDRCPPADP